MVTQKVTLQDVARASNHSVQVVSKILNGGSSSVGFSEKTKVQVLEMAAKLGYQPNHQARAMRLGRTGAICLLLDVDQNFAYLPPPMLHGMIEECEKRKIDLKVSHLDYNWSKGSAPRAVREIVADGLLIDVQNPRISTSELSAAFVRQKTSVIWLNRFEADNCINFNDFKAVYDLTELAIKDGLTRIAYVDFQQGGPNRHYSRNARPQGYLAAMRDHKLPERLVLDQRFQYMTPEANEAFYEWLAANRDVQMVITYSSEAIPVLMQCAAMLNIKLGRELAFGFCEEERKVTAYDHYFARQPLREFGIAAAAMLFEKIGTKEFSVPSRTVDFEVMKVTV